MGNEENAREKNDSVTVSATEVRDDSVTFHCMTNMNDYGKVRFSLTLVSQRHPIKLAVSVSALVGVR